MVTEVGQEVVTAHCCRGRTVSWGDDGVEAGSLADRGMVKQSQRNGLSNDFVL